MPDTPEQEGRFEWVLKATRIAIVASAVLFALGIIISVAGAIAATDDAFRADQWTALLPHLLAVVATLVAAVWLITLYGVVQATIANQAAVRDTSGRLERIETLLSEGTNATKELIDLTSLSDRAKSFIYRRREIEALRDAVHDELMHQDYNAAEQMIQTAAKEFGYTQEAARLREELENARKTSLEEKIDAAVGRLQKVIDAHDWPRAMRVAQKLSVLFPDIPKAAGLPRHVEAQRTKHKRRLLQEYGEVVAKNDVNRGIELLKELDRYLTPQEAAALEESARGVFRAKLHNLGVQFAICVADERWAEAVATGEEIIRGFPNSRMSHEVRQKMPQLRERVTAEVSSRR